MLKRDHSIKTNLVFVTGLQHAEACIDASTITMSVDTVSHRRKLLDLCGER